MGLQIDNKAADDKNKETRVNVRFYGPLARFIDSKVDSAIYNSSSEYLRDLVRRDMEAEIAYHVEGLKIAAGQLARGEFDLTDVDQMAADIRARRKARLGTS